MHQAIAFDNFYFAFIIWFNLDYNGNNCNIRLINFVHLVN